MSRKELKVVLCGGSGTGKSGLIMRLITDQFIERHDATIEDTYSKLLSVDNEPILLDILDTAGDTQFASMQEFWFREGEIFLVVYDITSMGTFNDVTSLIRKISDAQDLDLSLKSQRTYSEAQPNDELKPFVIVGNKCDLEDERQVPTESGQKLADRYGVPFFECSCFTMHNLAHLWEETVRLHRKIEKILTSPKHQTDQKSVEIADTKANPCCGIAYKQKEKGRATDNIQFYVVKNVNAFPDNIQPPVLALKNFRISRSFDMKRFVIAVICGLLLPLVIVIQTIAFLLYDENKMATAPGTWFYPQHFDYDTAHTQILLDFLGLMVGREPGQDPETVRNRKWFLRQNTGQKIVRVILCLLIAFAFFVLYNNAAQFDNVNVSRQETLGPLVLYLILWVLISSWVAFQPRITPPLPPLLLSRLRSIELMFGEYFTHRTSAYKFLRAYAAARQDNNYLSIRQYLVIIMLAAIFALIPGITRQTVGDDSDLIEEKVFWTDANWKIEMGAFVVNFLLVGIFILGLEVQYSKHFDNYRDWMTDLTLLLSKEQIEVKKQSPARKHAKTIRNVEEMIEMHTAKNLTPHKFGRDFSKHLFLSLTRRSNALGWLEIRSFLAIEGKLLFGEQELPTLFLMVGTLCLSFFIMYRVYFLEGNALESILFNGCSVLMIVCLISLIRIAITGYSFKNLQETQERLLGEQKLWMRCNVATSIGTETMDVKLAAFGARSYVEMKAKMKEGQKKEHQVHELQDEEQKEHKEEEVEVQVTDEVMDEVQDDNEDEQELEPLLIGIKEAKETTLLQRVDTTNWYTYNFGFIDDMIFIVRKKDIYPRLFKIKLNSVLAKAIAGILFSSVITFVKVFW